MYYSTAIPMINDLPLEFHKKEQASGPNFIIMPTVLTYRLIHKAVKASIYIYKSFSCRKNKRGFKVTDMKSKGLFK